LQHLFLFYFTCADVPFQQVRNGLGCDIKIWLH